MQSGAPPRRPGGSDVLPRRGAAALRGVAAGLVLGVATYAGIATGLLPGVLTLALALVLLLTVPSATGASARLALNGSIVLGWTQVLWWVHLPIGVNHAALGVATAVAGLAFVVVRSPRPAQALRALAPRWRRTDALPPLVAVGAVAAVHDLAFAGSARRALEVLVPGADNYVHFFLFTALRVHGSTLDVATAPQDGSGWAFTMYPTGFHTVVASLSELTRPDLKAGPDAVLAYAHGVALVVVLAMLVVSAAVVSLPRVRERPGVAAPALGLIAAAFLWEPGQKVLADGFASFWLGALAVGTALVLSVHAGRAHSLPHAAAIGGLMILVAHTWTPLLVAAAPAVLLLLWDRDPHRLGGLPAVDRRRLLGCLGLFALAGLAVLKAVVVLLSEVDVSFLVTAFGGLTGTSPLPTFLLIIASFYLCLSMPSWVLRRAHGADLDADLALARRLRLLVLAPTLGVGLAVLLFAAQMRAVGTTSYYFLKYLMGIELILAVLVAALLALLVSLVTSRTDGRRAVVLSVAATVVSTQLFGIVPGHTGLLLDDEAGGTASVNGRYTRPGLAAGIASAGANVAPSSAPHVEYVALGDATAAEAFYPDGWFHALTGAISNDTFARMAVLRKRADSVEAAEPLVRKLLVEDATLRVVVDPERVDELRAALGDAALADRVVAWTQSAAG